ncbi:MAG: hypothetical protein E6Q97_30805 [Desulfurellales bacterium]|nr:MAG: hypothetical protein E6Q97_30805 [Desulfurellales bacterium]
MANWYGTSRTNYFKVKDPEVFSQWAGELSVEVLTGDEGRVGLAAADEGYWPSSRWDDDRKDYVDVDFVSELVAHLQEGEVAVLVTAGAEKLRYVTGHAVAINSSGETLHVDISDIYDKAKAEWHISPTLAEY